MSHSAIAVHGRQHCVIDVHNLFVGTTLRDELLLLANREDLLPDVIAICSEFGVEAQPDRLLTSHSGGEQVIICCALLLVLLSDSDRSILFVHVLETLSEKKRDLLLERFRSIRPRAALFTLTPDGPQALPHA